MSIRKIFTYGTVWMACLGITMPTALLAGTPLALTPAVEPGQAVAHAAAEAPAVDIALGAGGRLTGRVVDAAGNAAVRVPVSIMHQGVQVVQCVTDENGLFVGENLHGGVHEVVTPSGAGSYRLWTPGAAPPIAQPQMNVVNGPVVRGQHMGHPHRFGFLANPWVLGMGVAAAIAIPLALDDDDDNAS